MKSALAACCHNYCEYAQNLLETEELHYNQKDSTIYTDHNVILRRNGKVGRGNGIRTTQSFNYYKVINPVGEAAFSDAEPNSE